MNNAEGDFELACFLAKAGLPIDTKVETKTFSHGYSKHWFKMMGHHRDWLMAILDYSDQGPRPTRDGWRKVQRLQRRFTRSANDFFVYTEKVRGDELDIGRRFARERFLPALKRWKEISDALKNGDPVSFSIKELFVTDEPAIGTTQ